MTNTNEDLGKRIEALVAEHIASTRRTAQEAVERAFGMSGGSTRTAARAVKVAGAGSKKRRAPADLAALGERFHRVLCDNPGETMAVLSVQVGSSARELHRAVAQLRRAGRVRAVGQRASMRYFPLGEQATA